MVDALKTKSNNATKALEAAVTELEHELSIATSSKFLPVKPGTKPTNDGFRTRKFLEEYLQMALLQLQL